jgi:hypothetical protein
MSKFEKGMIIKMSGLSVKKENGVFEINSTWEKNCSVYKLKKDGTKIASKYALDIFSYSKMEQYGEIITLDQVSAAITEINKQLKARKENEIIISFESTDEKEYSDKTYIKVIKPIQTTKSIYAISKSSVFQLSVNKNWNSVTWQLVGKKGELLSNYNGENMMNWSNKSMEQLFNEGYIEVVERVETVRKDIEQTEVSENVEETTVIETVEEVTAQVETTVNNETIEEVITTPETKEEATNDNEITFQTGTGLKGNGIEITFSSKPSEATRNLIKSNGYRWAGKNRSSVWWAILNDETLSIAEQLADNKQENNSTPEPVTYPEIEIDDNDTYIISQSLQDREHDSNWVMRKGKKDHNKEIYEYFTELTNEVKKIILTTENEYYIYKLKKTLQYYKKHYFDNYVSRLENKANNPSWVTTGSAGRNRSRDQKYNNRYDKLMQEWIELDNDYKGRINTLKNKIKRDQESALKEQLKQELSQPLPDLTFKTVTKEFDLYGNGSIVKTRFYECEGYSICKVWGAFRVFETSTSKEIYSTKSNGTLQDAKAYVSLMIKKQIAS